MKSRPGDRPTSTSPTIQPSHARLACIAMLASACTFDDNGIDPADDTPGVTVEADGKTIWRVKSDNPSIGSLFTLLDKTYAIRQDWAWEYDKFDLELAIHDADGQRRLYAWPEQYGTYGDDEGKFFFEGHGMKLLPGISGDPLATASTARAYYKSGGQEFLYEDPFGLTDGTFELDPAVALVPLRIVVLSGPELEEDGFVGPALASEWLSEYSAEVLFDDVWYGEKFTNTTPQDSPDNVVTEWTRHPGTGWVAGFPNPGSGRFFQPDRIFDQCDVQFREVSYHACEVPADILYDSGCNGDLVSTAHANTVAKYVEDECGLPSDSIPRVIFLGSLGGNNCFEGDLQGGQKDDNVFITQVFADATTLPHELGHLLGLPHSDLPNNLMQKSAGGAENTDLDEDIQCATVHERAREYQYEYWEKEYYIELPDWDKAPLSLAQQNARKLIDSLKDGQRKSIASLIGENELEKAIAIIEGDPSHWQEDVGTIVSYVEPYADELMSLLTEEQLALFPAP